MKPSTSLILIIMIVIFGEAIADAIAKNQDYVAGAIIALFVIVVVSVRKAQKEKA